MKKTVLSICIILFSRSAMAQQRGKDSIPGADKAFYTATAKWFSAWQLVHNNIYALGRHAPVDFIFFDEQYVYSTSPVTIPGGEKIKGPSILSQRLHWKKALHHDSITVPDKKVVPVGLMSFAADYSNGKVNSFFIMPLPSFWQQAGVSGKELGDENLYTGVFLHEFSHSQQMQYFGKQVSRFEKENDFGTKFTDDIVQLLFQQDSSYKKEYLEEVNYLYAAIAEKDMTQKKLLVRKGLAALKTRHEKYFVDKYSNLAVIDDFFLTMEGLGQFTMYTWLVNKAGAGLPAADAIKGVRRGGKWWSQDEGFALFLILDQLAPQKKWAKGLFGTGKDSVTRLIEQQLNLR